MKKQSIQLLGSCLFAAGVMLAQQHTYGGANVTGQLLLIRTVNLSAQAQIQARSQAGSEPDSALDSLQSTARRHRFFPEVHPSQRYKIPGMGLDAILPGLDGLGNPSAQSLTVGSGSSVFGFPGLTHYDQRNANSGNQFSLEPPSPGIAVGDGYVLVGVNNAVQVYTTSGTPLLATAVSTNQLFGFPAAINRSTGVRGVYPTDMRTMYDPGIDRWFVLQRSQANDSLGNPLPRSQEILAVSQTGDPTGVYNIYTIDTTNPSNFRCPCISDYPQIGADQYGVFISANEFNANSLNFALETNILAISKTSLASGLTTPTAVRFEIPFVTGYEFTIQPATAPPGGINFLANGGVEYFVSSLMGAGDTNLAIWAMSNTASLNAQVPNLLLTQSIVQTLAYSIPNPAIQRKGPLTYANTLIPPGRLSTLDGGDIRILSAMYAGGRLYASLGTQVTDNNGNFLAGGAFVVISPALRGGVLSGTAFRQGYLVVDNNYVLRPAIAVNALGKGGIVFTLVGPDYFPSAAFVPFDAFAAGSTIQVPGPGAFPEDGFTGYPNAGFPQTGIARWGDYSAAVVDGAGSIWMITEYIPNSPRTPLANWGTYVMQYIP